MRPSCETDPADEGRDKQPTILQNRKRLVAYHVLDVVIETVSTCKVRQSSRINTTTQNINTNQEVLKTHRENMSCVVHAGSSQTVLVIKYTVNM